MTERTEENAGAPTDAAITKGLETILKIQQRRQQRREEGKA